MILTNSPISAMLPSTDLKKSRVFYEKKLGLKVEKATKAGISLKAGKGTNIYVYKRGPSKAKHTLAGFMVKNLEKAIEEMTANGIKFEHYNLPGLKTDKMGIAVSKVEGEKAAWFKDPDGNILAVSQML